MTYSWDPGYIASANKERYFTFSSVPLTQQKPPATRVDRLGPSSYRYVSQAPAYEGQLAVFLPTQSTSPTMMCVVKIDNRLVWKQVLTGTVQSLNLNGPYDPYRDLRKPSGRRRRI